MKNNIIYHVYLKKIIHKKYIVRFAGDAAWETAIANGWTTDYIVDFEDKVNKILYEIKPDSNTDSTTVKEKTTAAKLWCDSNEYIFKIVSESYFLNLFKSLHNRDIIKEINCSVDLTQRMRQFL